MEESMQEKEQGNRQDSMQKSRKELGKKDATKLATN